MLIVKDLRGHALINLGVWHFLQSLNNAGKTSRPIRSLERWFIEVEVVKA
jgi:hypothetical protein